MHIDPYLHFAGDCEAAFKFYEKTLGAKITAMTKHGDTPAKGSAGMAWDDKIMHATMELGGTTFMGSDIPPNMYKPAQGMRLSIGVSAAEADRLFAAMSEGANVVMPIQETFFAKRFAMLNDKFGTPWMIAGGLQG